jgi:hypothetical protein
MVKLIVGLTSRMISNQLDNRFDPEDVDDEQRGHGTCQYTGVQLTSPPWPGIKLGRFGSGKPFTTPALSSA